MLQELESKEGASLEDRSRGSSMKMEKPESRFRVKDAVTTFGWLITAATPHSTNDYGDAPI